MLATSRRDVSNACCKTYASIVQLLLDRGAEPSVRVEREMTIIEVAEAAGHGEIAEPIRSNLARNA